MVQDRSAYWCPVVQSPQEMLGLTFLHEFSSEAKNAGGCEKRQLLFSRPCASLPSFCRTSRPGWVSELQISFPSRDGVSLLTACEQQNQCRDTARLASSAWQSVQFRSWARCISCSVCLFAGEINHSQWVGNIMH